MKNMKASMPVALMTPGEPFDFWVFLCGALRRAPARASAMRPASRSYCGEQDTLDRALADSPRRMATNRTGPWRARKQDSGRTREGGRGGERRVSGRPPSGFPADFSTRWSSAGLCPTLARDASGPTQPASLQHRRMLSRRCC